MVSTALEVFCWFVIVNWILPLAMFLYPLTMMLLFKDFVFDGFRGPFLKFRLSHRRTLEPWHARLWRDWAGVGLYGFMCYRSFTLRKNKKTIDHEAEHCVHWLILGLSFYPLYLGHMLWILVTQRIKGPPYTKHPYLDCWSERLARREACQRVDIPPEQWPHGKKDLWPWW